MISIYSDALSLRADSPFACRIVSDSELYGRDYCPVWSDGENFASMRNGVLFLSGGFDNTDEWKEFISVLSPKVIQCEKSLAQKLGLSIMQEGIWMSKQLPGEPKNIEVCYPDGLGELWQFFERNGLYSEREGFIIESSHSLRHAHGALLCIKDSGKIAGVCLSVSVCGEAALIGLLAVDKSRRGEGLGKNILLSCEELLSGRKLFLLRERDKNEEFYISCGYKNSGEFACCTVS